MIFGIGTDIIRIARIKKRIESLGLNFITRIFSSDEQNLATQLSDEQKHAFYAKRFAGKEAVAKALHTGIGQHCSFTDIEILKTDNGAPCVRLSGKAKRYLEKITANKKAIWHISLSDDDSALAFVVLEVE